MTAPRCTNCPNPAAWPVLCCSYPCSHEPTDPTPTLCDDCADEQYRAEMERWWAGLGLLAVVFGTNSHALDLLACQLTMEADQAEAAR